ncbi:ABC transporter ATP-binding protein [Halobacillus sp. K22]|uniref:ABC transporter ATP-binding protein n=1 Tax=Halobacillus sp. K22 TaxID=3457431 RepID=UPI003FCDF684
MLCINHVSKHFKKHKVLNDISFSLQPGESILLLGPNGAGKTTLLRLIMGHHQADAGNIEWKDPQTQVGFVLQDASLMDRVTIKELIQFTRGLYPNPIKYSEALSLSGLEEKESVKTEQLSIGQKRKLIFALALIGRPKLLIMDEPTAGMDVSARKHVYHQIQELKENGMTILMTTHLLNEASLLGDRVLLLEKGKLVTDEAVESIESYKKWIRFKTETNHSDSMLKAAGFNWNLLWKRWELQTEDTDGWVRWLVEKEIFFTELSIDKRSMEEYFEEMTSKGGDLNEDVV